MATISLCMIVKNEEKVLKRCLDSVAHLCDEIVIVDTGSTDSTKAIASGYTDKVFDFEWIDDFSAARNFAFGKCTMDYIYSADADEVLDEENQRRFLQMKEAMLPEIEIVQMLYVEEQTQTVLNSKKEYRAKLFKRLRPFTWIDPIHETVRIDPVVFDSEIEILHKPVGLHSKRDFACFEKAYEKDHYFSENLYFTYAKELLKWGDARDLENGARIYSDIVANAELDDDKTKAAALVLAKNARISSNDSDFLKYSMALAEECNCSELQLELGHWFFEKEDYGQAAVNYYRAAFNTEPFLDIHSGGDLPLVGLAESFEKLGDVKSAVKYKKMASEWTLPEE